MNQKVHHNQRSIIAGMEGYLIEKTDVSEPRMVVFQS